MNNYLSWLMLFVCKLWTIRRTVKERVVPIVLLKSSINSPWDLLPFIVLNLKIPTILSCSIFFQVFLEHILDLAHSLSVIYNMLIRFSLFTLCRVVILKRLSRWILSSWNSLIACWISSLWPSILLYFRVDISLRSFKLFPDITPELFPDIKEIFIRPSRDERLCIVLLVRCE